MKLKLPSAYVGSDQEKMAEILGFGYLLLISLLPIMLILQVVKNEIISAYLVGVALAMAILLRFIFVSGRLRLSVFLFVVFFTLIITSICTFGYGINDITILGFPILIGFSSIVLKKRELYVGMILGILGVVWLGLGELMGWFTPLSSPKADSGDFIITSFTIIFGGFVAYTLTSNMKSSLNNAQQEIQNRRYESNKLNNELIQKDQIIEEINKKVINSFSYIRKLINLQQITLEEDVDLSQNITRKILAIETAHEQLLGAMNYNKLDVANYLDLVLSKFIDLHYPGQQGTTFQRSQDSIYLTVDGGIAIGILAIEIISQLPQDDQLKIELASHEEVIQLSFESSKTISSSIIEEKELLHLMVRQIKGIIVPTDDEHGITIQIPINLKTEL